MSGRRRLAARPCSGDQPCDAGLRQQLDGVGAAERGADLLVERPPPLGKIRRAGLEKAAVAGQPECSLEEHLGDGLAALDAALQEVLLAEGEAAAQERVLV